MLSQRWRQCLGLQDRSVKCCLKRDSGTRSGCFPSFSKRCQPADILPEVWRFAFGLCQHEDLLLGKVCRQSRVFLAHQEVIVRPSDHCWAKKKYIFYSCIFCSASSENRSVPFSICLFLPKLQSDALSTVLKQQAVTVNTWEERGRTTSSAGCFSVISLKTLFTRLLHSHTSRCSGIATPIEVAFAVHLESARIVIAILGCGPNY